MRIHAVLSGVSRVCPVLRSATLSSSRPSILLVPAICPGWIGLYARARVYVCKSGAFLFFLMREGKTLSTISTLSSKEHVIVFKRVLMDRVVDRVGRFCPGLGFQGVDSD